jgi:WS/DGAT/MGAT family acyltransferase
MQHLSTIDASFLHFETPETPMHVASVELLELPKGYAGDFYEDAKTYLSARLHLIAAFRRKLVLMPFDLANPVWVDDEDLDLEHHIRHVILPRPGSFARLEQLVGRLHSPLMDRSRPLWEVYIIEGLKSGQVALYTKMHHAGIDGQAGVELARVLFDPSADPAPVKAPRARSGRRRSLGVAELAGAALRNAGRQYLSLVKALPQTARSLADMFAPRANDGKRHFGLPGGVQLAPKTPFNVSISNQRAFAARSVPLAEVKQIGKGSGTSVNDVVLATCAGALKRYLADYDLKPQLPLNAAVPVSLRAAGNTDANNQVSMMLVNLATDIADPLERLMAINASSAQGKTQMNKVRALPTDFPSFGAPWLLSGLAALAGRARLAERLPPLMNVVISNVPGPQVPLYFAGAKLLTYYPVSIPAHGSALNVTVQSYNGALDIGLTACRRAVPDITDLADYIVDEHRQLLARVSAAKAPAAEPTAPARSAEPALKRTKPAKRAKAASPAKPSRPAKYAKARAPAAKAAGKRSAAAAPAGAR